MLIVWLRVLNSAAVHACCPEWCMWHDGPANTQPGAWKLSGSMETCIWFKVASQGMRSQHCQIPHHIASTFFCAAGSSIRKKRGLRTHPCPFCCSPRPRLAASASVRGQLADASKKKREANAFFSSFSRTHVSGSKEA